MKVFNIDSLPTGKGELREWIKSHLSEGTTLAVQLNSPADLKVISNPLTVLQTSGTKLSYRKTLLDGKVCMLITVRKPFASERKSYNLHVSKNVFEAVKVLAKVHGKSMKEVTEEIIEQHFRRIS